jgi:hypothetical protein
MLYVGTKGSENLFVFFGDVPWFFVTMRRMGNCRMEGEKLICILIH